jgi:outer membrane immunogenic protein
MKWLKLLLAAFGSLLATVAAKAADLMVKAPPAAAMPAFSWTGCYVGLNGGGAWGRQQVDSRSSSSLIGTSDIHTQSAVLGGQLGCDFQVGGNWVIGLEDKFDGVSLRGQAPDFYYLATPANYVQANTRWLDSVTARVGFAGLVPHTMVYVKGGGAWAGESYNINSTVTSLNGAFGQTVSGWTAGAGLAWAIDSHWSIFAEYDHYDFSRQSFSSVSSNDVLTINGPIIDSVQVGLNYRFLGP